MQGYQRHTALQGGHCPGALSLCPIGKGLAPFFQACIEKGLTPFFHPQTLGRGLPAVLVCPGHVRRFHPYPPSRRRRR
jgi:hypothetical protein